MEKSENNENVEVDENEAMGETPIPNADDIFAASYEVLTSNMDELRFNLEKHLHLLSNVANDSQKFGNDTEENPNKNTEDADRTNSSLENVTRCFKNLAARAKVLTEEEIKEFEEMQQQNASNAEKTSKPSKVIFNINELGSNDSLDDMGEGTTGNSFGQIVGHGLNYLHEVERPTEFDQGAMKKYLKYFHNSLVQKIFKHE